MTEPPILSPRPPVRGAKRYDLLKQEIATPPPVANVQTNIFSLTITAAHQLLGRDCMDISTSEHTAEQGFLLNIIFKPNETGLRLRPEETQLLLAYIGEILAEIEIEEKLIIQEQQAAQNTDVSSTHNDEVTHD